MLYEVVKGKTIVACTDQIACIDDDNTLKALKSAGHTFKLNGKKATINEVKSFRESGFD